MYTDRKKPKRLNIRSAIPIPEKKSPNVFQMLTNRKVTWWKKLIPLAGFFYFLLPDFIPCIVDDSIVMTITMVIFWALSHNDIKE